MKVFLPDLLCDAPNYWKNFIKSLDDTTPNWMLTPVISINLELSKYNARAERSVVGPVELTYLYFKDAESYSFFVLKWV